MNHFEIRDGVMHAEDVSLEALAAEVGTPAYVYSAATLRRHARVLRGALDDHAETAGALILAGAVTFQAGLGIVTLLEHAPIPLALAHQMVAILVLSIAVVHAERLWHGVPARTQLPADAGARA